MKKTTPTLHRRRGRVVAVGLVAAVIALTACSGGSSEGDDSSAEEALKITYVNCGASTGFFATIAKGAETAAENMGNVDLQIVFPDQITPDALNQVLDTTIASKPDGIVLCGLDPKSAESAVAEGKEQGIAFSLSPSDEPYAENPLRSQDDLYISRVGSDETASGELAGQQIVAEGATGKVLCAGAISTDATINQRCSGAQTAVEAAGGTFVKLDVKDDPGQATELLTQYLRKNTDITGVLVPSPGSGEGIQPALAELGMDIPVGAWDLYPVNLDGIEKGVVNFTIDQQQYLRGYVPVQDLVQYLRYGLVRSNWYLTGPKIVDESDVELVKQLVEEGIR